MKRIQYHRYGGPEVLQLEEFEPRRPRGRQVLVRVYAAASNPMDWMIRSGAMRFLTGWRFPRGLGHDFAGLVVAVGDRVTRVKVGDEVFGATLTPGAFGESVIANERWVTQKPANLSFEEAAAITIVGGTAYHAVVNIAKLRAGQSLFVTGCLGGVGRAATEIARNRGVAVGGSCRSTAAQEARDLGIDPVVDFDFDPAPLQGRFDVVFDTSGVLPITAAQTLVKPGGRIIDIKPTLGKMLRAVLPGPYTFNSLPSREVIGELARAAEAGMLRQPIARTVPLAEAIPALAEFENLGGSRGGKLIVTTR
ncbi:NADP-dependent oxidoreductase [Microbacterium sp. RD1]|uniref:NADP-dependent oxidoreductase n=1 Tax=Microbacterium sp. RD1 TaxID=3457313 RepID=UPI003FA558F5